MDPVISHINAPIILWDIDTLDWKYRNEKKIAKNAIKSVSDGDIILMHDIYDTTASAVEIMVPKLIEKGYQLVTISELLEYKNIKPEPQQVIFNIK